MAVILRVGVLAGEKLRCMGSGLSPNGLPFSGEGVVSLALLDNIKYLDLQKGRITVEAGARIQPVSLVCPSYGSQPPVSGFSCSQQPQTTAWMTMLPGSQVL